MKIYRLHFNSSDSIDFPTNNPVRFRFYFENPPTLSKEATLAIEYFSIIESALTNNVEAPPVAYNSDNISAIQIRCPTLRDPYSFESKSGGARVGQPSNILETLPKSLNNATSWLQFSRGATNLADRGMHIPNPQFLRDGNVELEITDNNGYRILVADADANDGTEWWQIGLTVYDPCACK